MTNWNDTQSVYHSQWRVKAHRTAIRDAYLNWPMTVIGVILACILMLFVDGCGVLPGAKSPCDGLYCLSLEYPGVPGAALVCYQTEGQRDAAKLRLQMVGCSIDRDRAVCR